MLDVSECTRNPGTQYLFAEEQAIAPQEVSGETMTFEPVSLSGVFFADDHGNVTVDGKLSVIVHAHCANCLKATETKVTADYRETFLRDGDPEDNEIFVYTGHIVDLERLALSYVILNLPMRILCRQDCTGLLSYLPQDEFMERQKEMPGQHPFAALGQLLDLKTGSDADQD